MIIAALVVDGLSSALGLVPSDRPTADDAFGSIEVDYKLPLNVLATVVFVSLLGLTLQRSARDPVCGMAVDRASAVSLRRDGRTLFFCSEDCRDSYESVAS
jgi:YHS domain-containing protein